MADESMGALGREKELEDRFKLLFEIASDAILIHDLNGNLLLVNKTACKKLGYTKDELLRMNTQDINAPEYAAHITCRIEELLLEGHVLFETVYLTKDDLPIPIELSSQVIKYQDDLAVLSIARDISVRKRAEEKLRVYALELEEANSLKDLFIDIMRHDLLNPAGVVEGYAYILLSQEEDPKTRKTLKTIRRETARLTELIENASRFAKLESTDQIERVVTDLTETINNAILHYDFLFEDHNIKVDFKDKGEFLANINPLMMEDVFSNIISNAIKYSPPETTIGIGIHDKDGEWRVYIKDQGDGVKDENKEKLFTRFERLGKEGVKGTGLGLAIAKKIVDLHGGRIWVEDNTREYCDDEGLTHKEKCGSIFYVSLPKGETSTN